jgi:hypothetical protein
MIVPLDLWIASRWSANRKLRLRTRSDVRLDGPITSRIAPNGRELNVNRLAGDESFVAFVPPPTCGRAPRGSPAAAQRACPSE